MPDSSFASFTLSKYRAVELLGKGGFGTVYRAIDTTLDREVALKVLHPQLVADPTFVERFRTEAKIIAALRHPNVVGVYELSEEAGRLFIAMEYMPRGTLKDRLAQRGRLSFDETLTILQQVCAGLDAAHAKGMIHRDIKPGNILFDADGNAVVGDFGLARAMQLSSVAPASSSSGGVGTPFYKAPELWTGKPPTSPATDVYALTCMAYEMLTGRVLFDGDTPAIVMTRHVLSGPDFGTNWPPTDAPQGLSEVIQRGIARNPEERYVTAKGFAEALIELILAAQRVAELAALEAKRRQQEAVTLPLAAQRQPGAELKQQQQAAEELRLFEAATQTHPKREASSLTSLIFGRNKRKAAEHPQSLTITLSSGVTMDFVHVSAGEFLMGSDDGDGSEKPQHRVYLDNYFIAKYPVTVAQFAPFIAATQYQHQSNLNTASHPVTNVSWVDAIAFCKWASKQTGEQVRLPSEAEWEKAARGADGRVYPWGNEAPTATHCNFGHKSSRWIRIWPVEQYSPTGDSPYGCVGMAGNVWE